MGRGDLTNAEWNRLESFRSRAGRWSDHSQMQDHDRRPAGLLTRLASCLAVIVLLLLLLVGSVLVWILVSLHRADEARDQKSKEGMATMVATAERLRGGLAQKDSDGVLTDREVAEVLNHRPVLSIAREPDRTVLVVRLSADSQVQCYSFTALHTTDVTRRPLDICPPSKPSAPAGHSQ